MILHFRSHTLQTFNRCRRGPSKPSTWTLPLFCHPAHSILSRPPGCNGGEYCKFIERKRNLRKSLTILFCLMSLTRWSACWLTKHQLIFYTSFYNPLDTFLFISPPKQQRIEKQNKKQYTALQGLAGDYRPFLSSSKTFSHFGQNFSGSAEVEQDGTSRASL